mmetsp:Transcript_1592/g.3637  ORF Transcript_1592/g.3637 Transcript_1592/m.3637 type:complete len:259 (+) Transcript_1592:21-797(+)|eukprot:CAMPEP_0177692936 /NCGR_PEP_ID=MMETSP0484_2-20121128/2123_1 /TAXON_ID=354590 /ORGANISM="Rhodomonas lens, Strain RHODO" /LENGTH=258 /DNA_ID=CAMNT_0019203695 /DNA_START=11 /DNA_END=787 /DNA_ORIENTATION=+
MARLCLLLLGVSLGHVSSFAVQRTPSVTPACSLASCTDIPPRRLHTSAITLLAKDDGEPKAKPLKGFDGSETEPGILLKGAWVAAEALGNVAAAVTGKQETDSEEEVVTASGISREALMTRLRAEYDNEYFISGKMDLGIYEEDCLFADPFASFNGKERFKQNLANLGLFVSDSECRLISLDVDESDQSIKSRVMVKLQLKLPWKPVLAWPWGVKYIINEQTGLIAEHIESWEIDAGAGVAQVFKPGPPNGIAKSKKP